MATGTERTIGQLVADATHDLEGIVRGEIALAKAEVTNGAKVIGKGAGLLAGAAFLGLIGLVFVLHGLSWVIAEWLPVWAGYLIVAAVVRNLIEMTPWRKKLEMEKIVSVGNISLSVFLGMAMISLKLWELSSLALPLISILVCQVIVMMLLTYFLAFRLLGSDYDAAVLVAGICGFGLGATPNAMANMSAVCYKYHYTVKPFLIVPIIGAMFVDLINTGIITTFLNWIG